MLDCRAVLRFFFFRFCSAEGEYASYTVFICVFQRLSAAFRMALESLAQFSGFTFERTNRIARESNCASVSTAEVVS